jgi:alpha-glucosidase
LLAFLSFTFRADAQKKIKLQSPNGNIVFNFRMIDKKPAYSIAFKGKTLVEESGLTLQIENENFERGMVLGKPVFRNGLENYELVVGKVRQVTSRYKEVILPILESVAPFKKIDIVVRAFDDGIAFRYEYPQQGG